MCVYLIKLFEYWQFIFSFGVSYICAYVVKSIACCSIDHIHDSRQESFDIIIQISHVVYRGRGRGANVEMIPFLGKSACLNSDVSAPRSHLKAKLWNDDFISEVRQK